ncbi:MAG: hypothetical protein HQK51_11935 [Oligoflexia bacterium]|nr:hypothetical protein [Oligoflexia bacterium]
MQKFLFIKNIILLLAFFSITLPHIPANASTETSLSRARSIPLAPPLSVERTNSIPLSTEKEDDVSTDVYTSSKVSNCTPVNALKLIVNRINIIKNGINADISQYEKNLLKIEYQTLVMEFLYKSKNQHKLYHQPNKNIVDNISKKVIDPQIESLKRILKQEQTFSQIPQQLKDKLTATSTMDSTQKIVLIKELSQIKINANFYSNPKETEKQRQNISNKITLLTSELQSAKKTGINKNIRKIEDNINSLLEYEKEPFITSNHDKIEALNSEITFLEAFKNPDSTNLMQFTKELSTIPPNPANPSIPSELQLKDEDDEIIPPMSKDSKGNEDPKKQERQIKTLVEKLGLLQNQFTDLKKKDCKAANNFKKSFGSLPKAANAFKKLFDKLPADLFTPDNLKNNPHHLPDNLFSDHGYTESRCPTLDNPISTSARGKLTKNDLSFGDDEPSTPSVCPDENDDDEDGVDPDSDDNSDDEDCPGSVVSEDSNKDKSVIDGLADDADKISKKIKNDQKEKAPPAPKPIPYALPAPSFPMPSIPWPNTGYLKGLY